MKVSKYKCIICKKMKSNIVLCTHTNHCDIVCTSCHKRLFE